MFDKLISFLSMRKQAIGLLIAEYIILNFTFSMIITHFIKPLQIRHFYQTNQTIENRRIKKQAIYPIQ